MGKFLDYYKRKYELKVFFNKTISLTYEYGFLYMYIYENEIENFRETFGAYFPYYVKNEDQLKYLNPDEYNFEEKLQSISKRNWDRLPIIPHRPTESSGVYGELFLDFYLKVVCGLDPLIGFASKRPYSSNRESTGIDNVVFDAQDNIIFYLSEAKFVTDRYSAKSGLLGDVRGSLKSYSHLSSDYINSYMDFVIVKASESNVIKNERIRAFVDKANEKADEGISFLDICVEEKVKLHVILFAIFSDTEKDVNLFDSIYKELSEELETRLKLLGVVSYGYEIVFIPTNNSSMIIKEEINRYYD